MPPAPMKKRAMKKRKKRQRKKSITGRSLLNEDGTVKKYKKPPPFIFDKKAQESLDRSIKMQAPFVKVEPLIWKNPLVLRSDPWPPGREGRILTDVERKKLYNIYQKIGVCVTGIDEDLTSIQNRIAEIDRNANLFNSSSKESKNAKAEKKQLETFAKELKSEYPKLVKRWTDEVDKAKLGLKSTSTAKNSTVKNNETILPITMAGFNCFNAVYSTADSERRFFGPPRLKYEEAEKDYPILKQFCEQKKRGGHGVTNYKKFLEKYQKFYDHDQFELLYKNSELDEQAFEMQALLAKSSPEPSGSDDEDDEESKAKAQESEFVSVVSRGTKSPKNTKKGGKKAVKDEKVKKSAGMKKSVMKSMKKK